MQQPNHPSISQELLASMRTNTENDLWQMSFQHPVLLIFLRHFGCTFCREALSDIAKSRASIEMTGTRVVFVHMTDNKTAERYFQRYGLSGAVHVSDPACKFYESFGLVKGNFTQLFGLQSWIRGFQAGVINGHGVGHKQIGDGFQMPGVFVLHDG
ncbi:MAG: SelL-related redox protein, partial [Bacteroidota bacterium]